MVKRLLGGFSMEILFGAWRSVQVKIRKGTRKSLLRTLLPILVI